MRKKFLILHHEDCTTAFLKVIYSGLESATVITCSYQYDIPSYIRRHDRIIMLGHGYPGGLFYMINNSHADLLRRKNDNLYIWCHADQYLKQHDLTGLATGMFISEIGEAMCSGIPLMNCSQAAVTRSNELFAKLVAEKIHSPLKELYAHLLEHYESKTCPIIEFNRKRIQLMKSAVATKTVG